MMQLRMTQAVHQEMRSDLRRSHLFAAERVGYVFIRPVGEAVLVATGYTPIPDEFYLEDNSVGARIDHRAIALAMKRSDINNEGILLVHDHYSSVQFNTGEIEPSFWAEDHSRNTAIR